MSRETSKLIMMWNKHRNKLVLTGLFFISFIVQLLINDLNIKAGMGSAVAQLIGSWLIAYVAVQFANKYYNFSATTWWIRLYAVWIGMSLIGFLLFKDELRTMIGN